MLRHPEYTRARLQQLGTDIAEGGEICAFRAVVSDRRCAELQIELHMRCDLEAAMAVAQGWPLLTRGGGVEVRQLPILTPSVRASAVILNECCRSVG